MSGISNQQTVTFYLQDRHLKDPIRLQRESAIAYRCSVSDIHLQNYSLFEHHSMILSTKEREALPEKVKAEGWDDFLRANALFIVENEFPKAFPEDEKKGKKRNIPEAIALLKDLAERLKFPAAQNALSLCCYWGIGVPKSLSQMVIYSKQAADQKFAIALYNMGWSYREGQGFPMNYQLAFEHYEYALKLGFIKAAFEIGSLYESAQEPNLQEALRYYQYAAGKGIKKAEPKIQELSQKLAAQKPQPAQSVQRTTQSAINFQDFFSLVPRVKALEEQVQQLTQQLAQKDEQIGELLKQQETHNLEMKAMLTLVLQKLDYESVAKNPDPLD